LGGGAAVWRMLREEWARTQPFGVRDVTPATLGIAQTGGEIARYSTREYARFSRRFERAATEEILRERSGTALVNDIAEGPDFRVLAEAGVRVATIWHVDVVDYVGRMYCRGWVRPEALVRAHAALEGVCPDVVQLIFRKQADCVRHSAAHIVPSAGMKDVILRCYPETAAEKIHVVEWGTPAAEGEPGDREAVRARMGIPAEAFVLLLLSRISPEKNQELLLRVLAKKDWGQREVHLIVAGEAAFMQGVAYMAKLRRLAGGLRGVRVHWAGYVMGQAKRDVLAAADLYVFPSKHESYGLTLMEAFAAGLPALTLDHAGARAAMRAEFGEMVAEAEFGAALERMMGMGEDRLREMGRAARAYAQERPFGAAAARVAEIILGLRART
jgi:glycosyltransferase involved in cell wall biosynthesis